MLTERLHVGRRDQLYGMTRRRDGPRPMMSARAGLHRHRAARLLCEKLQNLEPRELAPEHHRPVGCRPVSWNTFFARSNPMMLTSTMNASLRAVVQHPLPRHSDAVGGRPPHRLPCTSLSSPTADTTGLITRRHATTMPKRRFSWRPWPRTGPTSSRGFGTTHLAMAHAGGHGSKQVSRACRGRGGPLPGAADARPLLSSPPRQSAAPFPDVSCIQRRVLGPPITRRRPEFQRQTPVRTSPTAVAGGGCRAMSAAPAATERSRRPVGGQAPGGW